MFIKKFLSVMLVVVSTGSIAQERLIIVNEGVWQSDNGRLSYFSDGKIISNQWFRDVNNSKLGDTPNDIIQVNDNLIAIAMNWSNIVQFIRPDGKAVKATEDIPNNRKLASDGRYVYATSYGHECTTTSGIKTFEKGFVAKINVDDFRTVDAVEVGYEPEGIAYYNGYLFVANTGGYALQEAHEYESTISVIDAATMSVVRTINTGCINLYGTMSQSGRYLCINSAGDYYTTQSLTIIFDCNSAIENLPDNNCFVVLEYSSSNNCVDVDGSFLAIGARYSYLSGSYSFNYIRINPEEVFESQGAEGVEETFPGTVKSDIEKMGMPYGIYVNPYSGYIYGTDTGEYTSGGILYQWSPDGKLLGKFKVYINPGHFLAIKPDNYVSDGISDAIVERDFDTTYYNLQGIKVNYPEKGKLYITSGKIIIY